MDKPEDSIIPVERIESVILLVRGQRVIVDADLAVLYGVPTKRLNEQVRRNPGRFPDDFMFQLSAEERAEVVANCDHLSRLKFSPQLPYVFTEHGTLMAANPLRSPRAVKVSVHVVRAFVKLREMLSTHKELAVKFAQLESKLQKHDGQIAAIMDAIRQLMAQPETTAKPPMGFATEERRRKPLARNTRTELR